MASTRNRSVLTAAPRAIQIPLPNLASNSVVANMAIRWRATVATERSSAKDAHASPVVMKRVRNVSCRSVSLAVGRVYRANGRGKWRHTIVPTRLVVKSARRASKKLNPENVAATGLSTRARVISAETISGPFVLADPK